jgi:ribosome-binding ATPase YchF (GTP1/OBG family)
VRGASKGEGLGNKFLANIREVDAIVHVLRCFEDDDITHVEGRINPVGDAETIETELMLADLESLERRVEQTRKRAASKDKESVAQLPVMEAALKLLNEGKPARILLKTLAAEDIEILKGLNLLTSHPVLYVCNVAEADAVDRQRAHQGRGKDGNGTGRRVRHHLGRDRVRSCAAAGRRVQGIPFGARP